MQKGSDIVAKSSDIVAKGFMVICVDLRDFYLDFYPDLWGFLSRFCGDFCDFVLNRVWIGTQNAIDPFSVPKNCGDLRIEWLRKPQKWA